ncbi:hypothetical protein CVT24_009738, partial [Panaeolus cyanescens]
MPQASSSTDNTQDASSQPTANASAVSALRGRLNTLSLQGATSPSKGARGCNPTHGQTLSSSTGPSTTSPAVDVVQMHAEFVDLKEIVLKLIKSNNKLKDEVSTLKDQVLQLEEEVSGLKDEASDLQEELSQLQVENKDILDCQTVLADIVSSLQSELAALKEKKTRSNGSNPAPMPKPINPPPFNFQASRFYVVVKGRCPGVYSNLVWAKKLTDGLDKDKCTWCRIDGYQNARACYEDAERTQSIAIVDRDYPNDSGIYGPVVPFIPWRQSYHESTSVPEAKSEKRARTTQSSIQRKTKVVTVRRKPNGKSSIKSSTLMESSTTSSTLKSTQPHEGPSSLHSSNPTDNDNTHISPTPSAINDSNNTRVSPAPTAPPTDQTSMLKKDQEPPSQAKTATRRKTKLAKDKLTDWKDNQRQQYLDELLRHEGPINSSRLTACADCQKMFEKGVTAGLRCLDCTDGYSLRCEACVLALHINLPFHRIEQWEHTHFRKRSTYDIGLVTVLGHDGETACSNPLLPSNLLVLHTNGWNTIRVQYCGCSKSHTVSRDIQLFRARMLATSSERMRTAFTFDVMELFHELNLQAKITAYDFYHTMSNRSDPLKLRKQPSQLNNFHRVIRIWRHLYALKRAGCAHNPQGANATQAGQTMVECPACPHPLKNLPSDWDTNTKLAFLYTLFVAVDANFKLKGKDRGLDDVELGPGWGAFVEEVEYQAYLSQYEAEPEINTCDSEHDAVLRASIRQTPGYSVTGAGLVICSRHCLVRPNGAGDLQKGEKYCNMDYIIFSALAGLCLLRLVITYDIACQWSRNYRTRMKTLPPKLQLSEKVSTRVAIPSWHINAHGKSCQQRFHVGYLDGVGRLCGDEVEQTWWITNALGVSVREMGPAGRRETLNDHWNAFNFRKIINFRKIFLKTLKEAVRMAAVQLENFNQFSESFSNPNVLKEWEKMVIEYEQDPETKPNPYEDTEIKITLHDVRLKLGNEEQSWLKKEGLVQAHKVSMVSFLTTGLDLEEQQRQLRDQRLKLGGHPTAKQEADFQEKHASLFRRILLWRDSQKSYMPNVMELTDGLAEDDEIDSIVEDVPLFLPSSLTSAQRVPINRIASAESRLREAQMEEALGEICRLRRILVGVTAFKTHNLAGEGNKANTRIRSTYARLNERIVAAKKTYQTAYTALLVLDPDGAWRKTLKELRDEDIRGPGREDSDDSHGNRVISWIWLTRHSRASTDVVTEPSMSKLLHESVRVEWAQSRARSRRWEEEIQLVVEEMRRVVTYLRWKSTWWETQASQRPNADRDVYLGLSAYAHKQALYH